MNGDVSKYDFQSENLHEKDRRKSQWELFSISNPAAHRSNIIFISLTEYHKCDIISA